MRFLHAILLGLSIISFSGCYSGIHGRVVDNSTGKPLEGSLVVVQWTKPVYASIEGISRRVVSNSETLTDKDGKFIISNAPLNPFAQPAMIIYKEGYIPWRNDMIFPGGSDRLSKDHEWKNARTYHLENLSKNITNQQIEIFLFLPMGGNEIPKFNELKDTISRRVWAELDANSKK